MMIRFDPSTGAEHDGDRVRALQDASVSVYPTGQTTGSAPEPKSPDRTGGIIDVVTVAPRPPPPLSRPLRLTAHSVAHDHSHRVEGRVIVCRLQEFTADPRR